MSEEGIFLSIESGVLKALLKESYELGYQSAISVLEVYLKESPESAEKFSDDVVTRLIEKTKK